MALRKTAALKPPHHFMINHYITIYGVPGSLSIVKSTYFIVLVVIGA
ncbi:MAG: hypothetical protein JSV82_05140 [Planctomycetota bacterium]|nr:MAG: hypothetical protein JSV82_05140 [Planctomycetota bacterium]